MTPLNALRFVAYQASYAETCEEFQAVLLLLPAMLRVTDTPPMNGYEAEQFRAELRDALDALGNSAVVSLVEGRAG